MLIPAMKQVIDKSTELGVESIVMGMPHRGERIFIEVYYLSIYNSNFINEIT